MASANDQVSPGVTKLFTATLDGEAYVVELKVGPGPMPEKVVEMFRAACSQPVAPGRLDEIVLAAVDKCNPHSDGERFCLYNVIETAIREALAAPPQVSAASPEPEWGTSTHDAWCDFIKCLGPCNCNLPQRQAAGAVSAPRCPKCAQTRKFFLECGSCDWEIAGSAERIAAQFFQPEAQPSPWVSVLERLPEDDSDVFAAIWWRNGDNPDYSRYVINDCLYYEGGEGSGKQKIFSDCEGEEFEPADVQYWVYKKDLAATLPAQPSPEGGSKP